MIVHGDTKIAAAFVKARAEIGATVIKDARGNYGKYATLAALTEATVAAFAKHGCALVQEASVDDSGVTVETWIVHEAGGMIQFAPLTLPVAQRTAQAIGSAITYGRRYAMAAVCGIAPDDDDGEAASVSRAPAAKVPVSAPAPAAPNGNGKHAANLPFAPTPDAAYAWAVEVGASENVHAARNAFKRLLEEQFGGKLTKANASEVYDWWYVDRMDKLSRAQQEPATA